MNAFLLLLFNAVFVIFVHRLCVALTMSTAVHQGTPVTYLARDVSKMMVNQLNGQRN